MRYYGFGNYYLSPLQQGLQAMHGGCDMSVQEQIGSKLHNEYVDWAKNHKTVVLLNGGNQASLNELHEFLLDLQQKGYAYPVVKFNEDEQSLGMALTHVGVIVPEKVYQLSGELPKGNTSLLTQNEYKHYEVALAIKLGQYRLAGT